MDKKQQTLLTNAVLPALRKAEFYLKNHKNNYWETKRSWDRGNDADFRATRSPKKREEIRARKFEESEQFARYNERLAKCERDFSELWDAIVDAGICDPATLRSELDKPPVAT